VNPPAVITFARLPLLFVSRDHYISARRDPPERSNHHRVTETPRATIIT
jgi:hypothetical protein